MPCSGTTGLGTVTKILPLTVEIGNPRAETLLGGWPNPYFGRVGFTPMDNVDITDGVRGHRFVVPAFNTFNDAVTPGRFEHTYWVDTGEFSGDLNRPDDEPPEYGQTFFNLTDSEFVFRYLPIVNDATGAPFENWYGSFQMYDFGEAGAPQPSPFPFSFILIEWKGAGGGDTIELAIGDDVVDETTSLTYDTDTHYWWRIVHDSSGDTISIQTAPKGCTSGNGAPVWHTQLSGGPMVNRISSYTIEFTWDTESASGHTVSTGMVSELNQQPFQEDLFLFTQIGDPLVPGSALKILPLNVELEGSP